MKPEEPKETKIQRMTRDYFDAYYTMEDVRHLSLRLQAMSLPVSASLRLEVCKAAKSAREKAISLFDAIIEEHT